MASKIRVPTDSTNSRQHRQQIAIAVNGMQHTLDGLGTAATQNTGTSGANVPLLNGANTWSAAQTFSAIPVLSAGGIKFPATQAPSADPNTLDDFEFGTWSPQWSVTSGTVATSISVGFYIKIGNFVFVTFYTTTGTVSSPTGVVVISGLPFSNQVGTNFYAMANIAQFHLTLASGMTTVGAQLSSGGSGFLLTSSGTGLAPAAINASSMTSGMQILGNLAYFAAN